MDSGSKRWLGDEWIGDPRSRDRKRDDFIMLGDQKEMEMESGDEVYRLPDLSPDERMRLISELPAHPSTIQVREKQVEILSRRPAK